MKIGTKEHYELMDFFERSFVKRDCQRESSDIQKIGHVYQNGEINRQFLAFRAGYAFGKSVGRDEGMA